MILQASPGSPTTQQNLVQVGDKFSQFWGWAYREIPFHLEIKWHVSKITGSKETFPARFFIITIYTHNTLIVIHTQTVSHTHTQTQAHTHTQIHTHYPYTHTHTHCNTHNHSHTHTFTHTLFLQRSNHWLNSLQWPVRSRKREVCWCLSVAGGWHQHHC